MTIEIEVLVNKDAYSFLLLNLKTKQTFRLHKSDGYALENMFGKTITKTFATRKDVLAYIKGLP